MRRRSSVAEQRTHKPSVAGSNPAVGTEQLPSSQDIIMTMKNENARSRASRREAGLIQRVRASLRREVTDDAPTILIACSGGMDSVVLAHALGALHRTGEIQAEILHVDHAVRDDSARDARIVEALAADLGMPFHLRRLEPGVLARHSGAGPEEALRRERFLAYVDVAASVGAAAVAVGHHQRDQAETVLLHLIRGAGLAGASGMREWSGIDVPWWVGDENRQSLRLWRPLLSESYETIEEWHAKHALPLAEDETNLEPVYRRNLIRHQVLPQLEAIAPGAIGNLARFAGLAAEDEAWLEYEAGEVLDALDDDALDRTLLLGTGVAIQRRIVRRWLLASGFSGELTLDRVDAVRELARRNRSGAIVEIGTGWRVRMDRGVLSVEAEKRVP